jgi:CRP-like cAMP-binding protein
MPHQKISADLYEELQKIAMPMFARKETVLFHAGRPARGAFLIRSRKARLTLSSGSTTYLSRVVGSVDLIGLPATFSGEPYSLRAEVTQDCRLEFITRKKLFDLLRHNPKVGLQMVRLLSEEIYQMRKRAKLNARPTNRSKAIHNHA